MKLALKILIVVSLPVWSIFYTFYFMAIDVWEAVSDWVEDRFQ